MSDREKGLVFGFLMVWAITFFGVLAAYADGFSWSGAAVFAVAAIPGVVLATLSVLGH